MTRFKAHSLIAFCALLSSFNFLLPKIALGFVDPFLFLCLRFLIASLVIVPFAIPDFVHTTWRESALGLLNGAIFASGGIFVLYSLYSTNSGEVAFIVGTTVLFVPVLSFAFYGQRINRFEALGLLIGVLGLALLNLNQSLTLSSGTIFALLAAILFAVWVVLLSKISLSNRPRVGAFYQVFAGVIISAPFAVKYVDQLSILPLSVWLMIFYVGAIGTGLRMVLQTKAQRYTSATQAETIYMIEPIGAILWGTLLGSEVQSLRQLVGCILILGGIWVAQRREAFSVLRVTPK